MGLGLVVESLVNPHPPELMAPHDVNVKHITTITIDLVIFIYKFYMFQRKIG